MKKKAQVEAGAPVEKTEKKKSVGSVIVTVVLILCILLAIIAGYSAYTSKAGSGVPSVLGFRPFAVQSDSMAPFFYEGDLIVDRAVNDPSELEVGDVITFWTVINGQKVLNSHRIVRITDYDNYLYFDTKGDNNPIEDTDGVHQNDIVGKYLFKIPNLGTVLDFLQTTAGFGICIVLPVAIYFIYEIVSFFRTLMAYKTEKVRLEIAQQMGQGEDVPDDTKAEEESKETKADTAKDSQAESATDEIARLKALLEKAEAAAKQKSDAKEEKAEANETKTVAKEDKAEAEEDKTEAKEDKTEAKEDKTEAKEEKAEAKEDKTEAKEEKTEAEEDKTEAKAKKAGAKNKKAKQDKAE